MASKNIPIGYRGYRGNRTPIPKGYILGRKSGGEGPVELLRQSDTDYVLATAGGRNNNGGGSGREYDIGLAVKGVPATSAVIAFMVADRQIILPATLPNTQGYAQTAPSGSTVFTIRQNGTGSLGTATFAASGKVATFSFTSGAVLAIGDRLEIVSPGAVNGIADLAFTFRCLV